MAPCFHHLNLLQILFTLLIVTRTKSLSHDQECFSLYLFKHSFPEVLGVGKFESWKISNSSDCCLWEGVECSNQEEGGYVIGLELSESFLSGPLNSSSTLFNLVHLQTLNLALNDFTDSQIPSRISRLKELKSLNLSRSGFKGQIPDEISHLIHLSSLDLSGNPLKLQSPSLEKLVQNLTRLEQVDLSEVDVSSSVPHFMANFSSLKSMVLYDCSLQNEFPSAILELPKLKFLDLASNPNLRGSIPDFRTDSLLEHLDLASTSFFGIVPESISNLHHLTFLRLTSCYFAGNIPGSLSNLTQLSYLSLAYNEFTGQVPSLTRLSELNHLELSGSKLETRRVPDWLGKLTKLDALYLNRMNIDEIPPFLSNLTKLSVVMMEDNSMYGPIPSSFMNLTQLRRINFAANKLHGPIPSSFSNFKNLQLLYLFRNDFSGRVDLDMFVGLNQLDTLHLSYNKISIVATNNYTNGTLPELKELGLASCNLKEFPAILRFQNKLRLLFLSDNKIGGHVPEWMWNNSLEALEMIDLENNFITGFHQQYFLPWVRLQYFNMANNQLQGRLPIPPPTLRIYYAPYNNLQGEIPPLLCEVKSLQLIDLSSNNISGTLPSCLGRLSNSLQVLDLKRNNLQGTMMNTFTQGCMLKYIDLSENQLVGRLSKSLTSCTDLEFLSLGDNSFDDIFPFWLGTFVELRVLILRSNKFYGRIQGPNIAILQFPNLRIIDLSNNGFGGPLPHEYFQTWNAMKSVYDGQISILQSTFPLPSFKLSIPYQMTITSKGVKREYPHILDIFTAIDLSCNNFEGEIPQSLQDLRGLESLNLSNNHLIGGILPSLGNLKNLESLDLSRNKLSGEIPHQLLQLGFLAILNLSFNHLDGRIPHGGQFNTFENNSYEANPGLCGEPLSKDCQDSKASTPSETSNKSESFFPSESVDWIVIFCGVGGGFVVGILVGNFIYPRYYDRVVKPFRMRKNK